MEAVSIFAPEYEREEHGWIVFPRDTSLRRELLGEELAKQLSIHPAKMNMHLCKEIIKFNTQPGQTILDPFGGVGTTLIAGTLGRNVLLCELEQVYFDIAQKTAETYTSAYPGVNLMVFQGDNQQLLPIPCDHIITSPPYGNDLYKKEGQALDESIQDSVTAYGASALNIGQLNPFLYNQAMIKLYKKMVASLRPGGTITITHRDRTRGDERLLYGLEIMRTMSDLGMKLTWWEKWKAPGSIQSRVNEKKGAIVILDEDILCFSKAN